MNACADFYCYFLIAIVILPLLPLWFLFSLLLLLIIINDMFCSREWQFLYCFQNILPTNKTTDFWYRPTAGFAMTNQRIKLRLLWQIQMSVSVQKLRIILCKIKIILFVKMLKNIHTQRNILAIRANTCTRCAQNTLQTYEDYMVYWSNPVGTPL